MAEKTNAMRKLASMKIAFKEHYYADTGAIAGADVARALGEDPARVFKTLVTVGKTGAHYVFLVPVEEELDLKKAAASVGEKSVEMIKSKELLPLTGYIHGGCSPIGMKKFFRTVVHKTAEGFQTIYFSGGKIGLQIELPPETLAKVIKFEYADIIR
jgi:Cys-tRNA(Pro)/Cys-tRNA(Cys) deacylase